MAADEEDFSSSLAALFATPEEEEYSALAVLAERTVEIPVSSDGDTSTAPPITVTYELDKFAPGHGNVVWNASLCLAWRLAAPALRHELMAPGLEWPPARTLEFGAGAGIPSFVCLATGVPCVVITDQPGSDATFAALERSAQHNAERFSTCPTRAKILPHLWGDSCATIIHAAGAAAENCFNLLIASDCIYNPAAHAPLLSSCLRLLDRRCGRLLVGFSLHSNVPDADVLAFFATAALAGLAVIREGEQRFDSQSGAAWQGRGTARATVYYKVLAFADQ